jgi:anti-sigma28 factor (negative regulator of flagellin synthesis)
MSQRDTEGQGARAMSDTGRIGDSLEILLPMPVGATGGMPASVRSDATEASRRSARPQIGAEAGGACDTAQVSLIGTLISQASVGSEVRFAKVASLRQAIQAGKYRVSAADLAERLMEDLQRPKPEAAAQEAAAQTGVDGGNKLEGEVRSDGGGRADYGAAAGDPDGHRGELY